MNLYEVSLSDKTQKRFKDEKIPVYPKIILGINYFKIYFITIRNDQIFREYSIEHIE